MRPQTLNEIVGQSHLIGENGILTKIVAQKASPSLILWGPPGVGKTSIALLLAKELGLPFVTLSAISSGIKEVKETIEKARFSGKTLVFIDEIHRFNKTQQDSLLGAVEKGIITLIGETTENPSFEVVNALLSRCQVYNLKPLEKKDLELLIQNALTKDTILSSQNIVLKETDALIQLSGGDARKVLNLLELVVNSFPAHEPKIITNKVVSEIADQNVVEYDKNGEYHYDIISALIKSIRGSDPNAALYYLGCMIEGGEDLKFIARRLIISASEDIGLANPTALIMANNCFQAVNVIGYPEAAIILSQTVVYLACSPKSNSSYKAIKEVQQFIRQKGKLPVPLHLRNATTQLMKQNNYGKNYQYAHDFEGHFVVQEYLPAELSGTKFYEPANNAREQELRTYLKKNWKNKYGY
jgi:putative ATPase